MAKKITVNFRLNSTGKNTFPVQMLVNLGGRKNEQGKFIVITKNVGITLKKEDWNFARKLPRSNVIANRLLKIEEKVKELFEDYNLDTISNDVIDVLKNRVELIIDAVLKVEPIRSPLNEYISEHETRHYDEFWIKKLQELDCRIIDARGRTINPNKFFNVLYDKEFLESMVDNFKNELVPDEINENDENPSTEHSLNLLKNKDDKYPILFHEYIRIVADLKSQQIKDRLTDKREYLKLAKKFEVYDKTLTLGQYNDKVGLDFLNWIKTTDKFNIKSINSYGAIIKVLKSVLIYAKELDEHNFGGYPANLEFVNIKKDMYSKQVEEVDNVYVNEQMLKQLYDLDLSTNEIPQLEYVRDLFIIGAYTAARFGDLNQMFNVQKYKNNDVYYIEYRDNKEGVRGQIPVPNFVYDIIKKYNFKFEKIENTVFNKLIKLVCNQAGWDKPYYYSYTNLITNKTEQIPSTFAKMVSSHTMRRSFATNMFFHRKMDKRLVMNFTLHRTEEVFDNYIKVKQLQYVDEYIHKFIEEINA
jgi:integrase